MTTLYQYREGLKPDPLARTLFKEFDQMSVRPQLVLNDGWLEYVGARFTDGKGNGPIFKDVEI